MLLPPPRSLARADSWRGTEDVRGGAAGLLPSRKNCCRSEAPGSRERQPGRRAGIRKPERAPGEGAQGEGERALRSRTTRPCPPIIVRVTDGGRTVDRRSKARWSRAARPRVEGNVRQTRWMRGSERASERHGVMAAAPKSDARRGREREPGNGISHRFSQGVRKFRPPRVHCHASGSIGTRKRGGKGSKSPHSASFSPSCAPSVTSPRAAAPSPLRGGG